MCNQLNSAFLLQSKGLGATGVLCKSLGFSELHQGIAAALSGEEFWPIDHIIVRRQHEMLKWEVKDKFRYLTGAEKTVLGYLRLGMMNKDIGSELGITVHTVKAHVSNIFRTLGAKNRTELIVAMRENTPCMKRQVSI
jgi:DNA-binding NarL/FixJ family response regulator